MTCESDIHPSMQLTHIYWQRVWPCVKHVFFWCFDVRGHVIIEGLPLLEWPILDETTHLSPVCAPFIVRLIDCIPHSTNLLYWAFPLWATVPNPWCARTMPDGYRQTPHIRAHWNVQPSPPRTCLPPHLLLPMETMVKALLTVAHSSTSWLNLALPYANSHPTPGAVHPLLLGL